MSDNVAITGGSGTSIATHNIGGVHHQKFVEGGGTHWTANHAPSAATQATITQASGGAGVQNVCTSITVSLSSSSAPTAAVATFNLRDGATGAGTILWTTRLSLPATAGISISESFSCWIEGSTATAMTLETSGATASNVFGTVAMTGTTI